MQIPVYSQTFQTSGLAERSEEIELAVADHLEQQTPLPSDYEELFNLAFYLIDTIALEAGWGSDYASRQLRSDNVNYPKAATAIACVLLENNLQTEPPQRCGDQPSEVVQKLVLYALEFLAPECVTRITLDPNRVPDAKSYEANTVRLKPKLCQIYSFRQPVS